jgi:hypothetical protein
MTAFNKAWEIAKTYKIQDWRGDTQKPQYISATCESCGGEKNPDPSNPDGPDNGLCSCGE